MKLSVNGRDYPLRLESSRIPPDALRRERGLTGTNMGCKHGVRGTSTVLVDGELIRACPMLTVQVQGVAIRTSWGLAAGDAPHPVERAFAARHGVQWVLHPGALDARD